MSGSNSHAAFTSLDPDDYELFEDAYDSDDYEEVHDFMTVLVPRTLFVHVLRRSVSMTTESGAWLRGVGAVRIVNILALWNQQVSTLEAMP